MQRVRKLVCSLVASVVLVAGWAAPAVAVDGKWILLAPYPDPSEEPGGAVVDGKLYVMGGIKPLWQPTGVVYAYDPQANVWTARKPMPKPMHHNAITVLDGKIYLFGGFMLPQSGPPAWVTINSAWRYDPATDVWTELAPMPTARGAAAAAVVNGKIYVVGGAAPLEGDSRPVHPLRPNRSLGTVEEYDPATNTWRTRVSMPVARNHVAIGAVNGKVYVIGGRLGSAFITAVPSNTDLVQEYDPATDVWALKAPMPTPRSGVAYAVIGDKIYVAGGEAQTPEYFAAFRALEVYDPATNRWEKLPSMPIPRHGIAGAALGNRFHLVGGYAQSPILPRPKGMQFHVEQHDVFEVVRP